MVLKQWIPACSLGLKSWEMIGKLVDLLVHIQ